MTSPFGTPRAPGASGPSMEELHGKLLIISVRRIERNIQTSNGLADGARCDLVELADGSTHPDAMLWGKSLVPQLDEGVMYVGRIEKGRVRQGNQSPPWIFVEGDAADHATGQAYLDYVKRHGTAPPIVTTPTVQAAPIQTTPSPFVSTQTEVPSPFGSSVPVGPPATSDSPPPPWAK